MSQATVIGRALGAAVGLLLSGIAGAAEWPDGCEESMLPSYPDAQLVLTCLPSDFNRALIVYAHGYVRPQEPLALPEEFANADVRELIEQLLDRGFGVATSSYHKNGYAVEQAEADLNDLVDHVRSRAPDLDAVYVIGASEGGLIATMLVEKYPESYAGGLALCAPMAGTGYQIRYMADVRVLFDYFYPDVFPFGVLDVPEDAHEQWDGPDGFKARTAAAVQSDPDAIARAFDIAGVTCEAGDHAEAANCGQDILAYSVFGTNDLISTAGGWPVSNIDREYGGAGDDAAVDGGVERFDADPAASEYVRRFYRPSGLLQRPLVTLHTTRDPGVPYRHQLVYFNRAALLGTDDLLTVLPVDRAGHCEFEAAEVLGGVAALLLKADKDLVYALLDPLEALHDIIDLTGGGGRLADMVGDGASDFVDDLEDEFGFVRDLGDAAEGVGGAVEDAAGDVGDAAGDVAENVGDTAGDAIDEVKDFGENAKDKVEDLF